MKFKKLPFKEFTKIYLKVPRPVIDIIIVSTKGILLTKRSIPPFKGMWHIPGGTILFKEPILHTINRIADDELSIKVKIIKHLGIIEYFNDDGRHSIGNTFLAIIKNGTPTGNEQGEKIKFFKTVPQNIIPEQGKFIKKHLTEIKTHFK